MRSISAKILLWTGVTFAASLVAFGGVSYHLATTPPGPAQFFDKTIRMIEGEAVRTYEHEGPERLGQYIQRLDAYYSARHHLTDARGVDLVTGQDHSTLVSTGATRPKRQASGEIVVVNKVGGDRYRMLVILPDAFDPSGVLPYFAGIVLAIGLLGYALAVHLARPLRSLRLVVDRFGGGDLAARARSTRMDEIGELSRAFDAMASQIQTLRAAELRLLQDISHELRSPLARLGFNLELARTADDPEVPFSRIRKDLDRLASLVAEILQLSCVEGDPTTRNLVEVELDDLLASLAEDCSAEAQGKSCRIVLSARADAAVIGDWELLRRGFENVLRNAIRHAPEGSAIEIDSRVLDGSATITVRDHGPGVPEEALTAIFNPFFRVDDDRSRSGGGVGLGLSIARRAIELHEGRIIARNAAPGLRVFIDLPVEARVPV
jgi:two-component system sensor histidine kinase CpxA